MDSPLKNCWTRFLKTASQLVEPIEYSKWFKSIVPISFEENLLVVRFASEQDKNKIENDYIDVFRECIKASFGSHIRLKYEIINSAPTPTRINTRPQYPTPSISSKTAKSAGGFKSNLDPRLTLENFFQSLCNRMVYTAAVSITDKPGQTAFNPLFVHGASGVGKTHILHAIGNEILKKTPQKRIVYVPAQIFKLQYVDAAIRRKSPEQFIHFYQNIDVLLIDDIQELTDAVSTQNAFFQIFNNLKQLGRQIVIASDRAPVDLQGLEDRLYTRLKWGLTAEIKRPDPALRRQILQAKMDENEVKLPNDVFNFIVKHADQNIRDIEGSLTSIMAHAVYEDQPINLELVKRVMAQTVGISDTGLTPQKIIQTVCSYLNVDEQLVLGRSRKQDALTARHLCIYLCKEYTNTSLTKIGKELGGRNHSTVLNSCKAVENALHTDNKIQKTLQKVEELLNV